VTVTGTDAVLLLSLGLLILSGWLVVFWGLALAEWLVYAMIVAGAVQLLFHPGALAGASPGLLTGGLLLAVVGLGLRQLTLNQLPKLVAAGRFREANWRDLGALSLWIAGAGCVMTVIHPVFGLALIAGVVGWVWFVLRPEGREVRTHVTIEVRCDPERAFAMVADPKQASRYTEDFEVDAPTNQEIGVGYRYHWRYRHRPVAEHVFEGDDEIVEYHPGRRIKVRTDGRPATGACVVEVAPGGTRVIHEFESIVTPEQALLGLRKKVKSRAVEMRERAWKRLKELLEAPRDSVSDEPVT
jgi:uncharacterized protein YndB with AHSA1/START domain